MTMHLVTFPFVLPLLAGALLMALADRPVARRVVAVAMAGVGLAVAVALMQQAATGPVSYQLGNWPWPFGITLHADRMSTLLLMLSAVIAAVAVIPGVGYDDTRNRYALALAQFQIAGINGSFLAGDLFNLFVCFEVMLISSYALMAHGHERVPRAGLIYTVINLVGSAIFLLGIAMIYGATGGLNLVDIAQHLQQMAPDVAAMGYTGAWLVALVFALKSAMLPLGLWLPGAYAVSGPMAVTLFALLTKVGVYALIRVFGPWLTSDTAALASLGPVLQYGALVSIALGALLALASRTLRQLAGALVVGSVATALLAMTVGGPDAVSSALFYMVHSTISAAAVFLLAACVARLRGEAEDRLDVAPAVTARGSAMLLFLGIAIVVTGMPPLSGFVGKVSVLQLLAAAPGAAWTIGVVLTASLFTLLAVARAGNAIFFRAPAAAASAVAAPGAAVLGAAAGVLLALSVAMAAGAGPLHEWTDRAALEASMLPATDVPAPSAAIVDRSTSGGGD